MKKILINVAKFGIVAAILYYLISSGRLDFRKLILFWETPSVLFTLLGVLIFWIVPIAALRWWLLLRGIGLDVSFYRANLLTWIGNFFNTTLPGAVSGDLVKGYYIIRTQEKDGKTAAFTTVLIDRFVGLFGLIVMAFVAMLLNLSAILKVPTLIPLATMILGLFAGTVVFYVIVLFPFEEGKDPFVRLFTRLPGRKITVKVYLAFKVYQHHVRTLILTLALSVVLHLSVAFLFFQVATLIGVSDLGIATQLFIMPIGLISIAVPLAPGGAGLGHIVFDQLYRTVGVSGGADIFNLYIIIQLAVFLIGVIPFLLSGNQFKIPDKDELDPELHP